MHTADVLIAELGLAPHPEGGHFREVYRSSMHVDVEGRGVRRDALTAIHFLLRAGECSRWHRVQADEVWHHAGGDAVELLLLDPAMEQCLRVPVGPLTQGHSTFHVVPAGWWQAARPLGAFSLCNCFVAPGFVFADFTLMTGAADRALLQARWPGLVELV